MKHGSTKRTTAAKQKVIAVYASGLLYTHIRGGREHSGRSVQTFFLTKWTVSEECWTKGEWRCKEGVILLYSIIWAHQGQLFRFVRHTGKPWSVSNSRRRLGHRKTLQMCPFTFKHLVGKDEVMTNVSTFKWEDLGSLNPLLIWHMAEGSH